jgi:ABC-2 type transport system permease protein
MFDRIKAIFIKEIKQVLRDPRMRMTLFVAPLVQVLVFGFASTTDVNNIPTAIYDLDNTKGSRDLIRLFTSSGYFDAKYRVYDDDAQSSLIDNSKVNVVIRFNRGFDEDASGKGTAAVQLILDGTDSNTASIILSYANTIVRRYSQELIANKAKILLSREALFPRVDMRQRAWFNGNLESKNFYIPGVIAMIISVMTLILTSMSIVREKEIGTMEQIMVSPIKPYELVLGKLAPFAMIALLDVVLVTVLAVLLFKVPVKGSLWLLLFSSMAYLMTSLGIGLFISTISSTQQEAMMSVFLFFFPANLLSGFMFPIFNMPQIVQYITYLNPLRYYLVILRGIFLKGNGIGILWPPMLVLFIMGVAILWVSSMRFRKTIA